MQCRPAACPFISTTDPMIRNQLRKIDPYTRYLIISFTATVLELALFTVFNDFFGRYFELLDISIATFLARMVGDGFNYLADRRYVFHAHGPMGSDVYRYIALVLMKVILSAALVTGIYLILPMIDETIIKMFVDTAIFFPAYFIEKKWVHKK